MVKRTNKNSFKKNQTKNQSYPWFLICTKAFNLSSPCLDAREDELGQDPGSHKCSGWGRAEQRGVASATAPCLLVRTVASADIFSASGSRETQPHRRASGMGAAGTGEWGWGPRPPGGEAEAAPGMWGLCLTTPRRCLGRVAKWCRRHHQAHAGG